MKMAIKETIPGVYDTEINAFPTTIVAVATSIPVFIGYTEKAEFNGSSLSGKPLRITSLSDYESYFGAAFHAMYTVVDASPESSDDVFTINAKPKQLQINKNNTFFLYNSIRLFYANGGDLCYIVSIGTYGNKPDGMPIDIDDFMGSDSKPCVLDCLQTIPDASLVVAPDVIACGEASYAFYCKILDHCAAMGNRFAIFDIVEPLSDNDATNNIVTFRNAIGTTNLNLAAAYYPWLHTNVVQTSEMSFANFDRSVDLESLLPASDTAAIAAIRNFKQLPHASASDFKVLHHQLLSLSNGYIEIMEALYSALNKLPPSGAIAGVYASTDRNLGVWHAPANVALSMVYAPSRTISPGQQVAYSIDGKAGKSINIIRQFPGIGTLIWGARTLDGNSEDYRYINIRRTLLMIEQSLRIATHSFVFALNNANTWSAINAMIDTFLTNLWKQGALAGNSPAKAFSISIGLGTTMTPDDVLNGQLILSVSVAVERPGEFIVFTLQQTMQK
jgi:phage tail sheath protein FI